MFSATVVGEDRTVIGVGDHLAFGDLDRLNTSRQHRPPETAQGEEDSLGVDGRAVEHEAAPIRVDESTAEDQVSSAPEMGDRHPPAEPQGIVSADRSIGLGFGVDAPVGVDQNPAETSEGADPRLRRGVEMDPRHHRAQPR